MLQFDERRDAATPIAAASVLVVSDDAGALEVFAIERSGKSGFLGGAIAFPGGKLDKADGWLAGAPLAPRTAEFGSSDAAAEALVVAAARESLEEAALVPIASPDGRAAALDDDSVRALSADLRKLGAAAFPRLLASRGLTLDASALVPFGRWVTPEAEARRFDARFFLLRRPPGQQGSADLHEVTRGFWSRPTELIHRFHAGEVFLAPPTLRLLELLEPLASVADALSLAAKQSLLSVCPRFVPADPPMLVLPGDPMHALAERRVEGPTRFVLHDGRFVGREAPRVE
jgi:8-oxo-dGTP pyrophosphatase MutT (NUDIX family)